MDRRAEEDQLSPELAWLLQATEQLVAGFMDELTGWRLRDVPEAVAWILNNYVAPPLFVYLADRGLVPPSRPNEE